MCVILVFRRLRQEYQPGYIARVYLKQNVGAEDIIAIRLRPYWSESPCAAGHRDLIKENCGFLEQAKGKAWALNPNFFLELPLSPNQKLLSPLNNYSSLFLSQVPVETILHSVSMGLLVSDFWNVLSFNFKFLHVVVGRRTLLLSLGKCWMCSFCLWVHLLWGWAV